MAAIKTGQRANPGPMYSVTDADGNPLKMHQRGATLVIKSHGGEVRLTQANASDLLPGIQAFSSYGTVT